MNVWRKRDDARLKAFRFGYDFGVPVIVSIVTALHRLVRLPFDEQRLAIFVRQELVVEHSSGDDVDQVTTTERGHRPKTRHL